VLACRGIVWTYWQTQRDKRAVCQAARYYLPMAFGVFTEGHFSFYYHKRGH
jgi:hypothetical protein